MNEHTLKYVAIVGLLMGLIALYILQPQDTPLDKDTIFTGRIAAIAQKNDVTLLKITRSVPAVIRDSVIIPCGSMVQFSGMYANYEGQEEFVVSGYTVLKEGSPSSCGR